MKKLTKIFTYTAAFLLVILLLPLFLGAMEAEETATQLTTITEQTQIIEEPQKPISDLKWKHLLSKSLELTTLQFDEYGKTLKGERISWDVSVLEVSENTWTDGYTITVSYDGSPLHTSIFDVSKKTALRFDKGQSVVMDGVIKSVMKNLGIVMVTIDLESLDGE